MNYVAQPTGRRHLVPPLLAFACMAALLGGCVTYEANYEVLVPATRELPVKARRILLVDRHLFE